MSSNTNSFRLHTQARNPDEPIGSMSLANWKIEPITDADARRAAHTVVSHNSREESRELLDMLGLTERLQSE